MIITKIPFDCAQGGRKDENHEIEDLILSQRPQRSQTRLPRLSESDGGQGIELDRIYRIPQITQIARTVQVIA